MSLTYYTKQVYGITMLYPADDKGTAFLKALGAKTFTKAIRQALAELGIELHRTMGPV